MIHPKLVASPKIQNIYGAKMQENWNSLQEVKTRKQYLLDMDHNETAQRHTAKYEHNTLFLKTQQYITKETIILNRVDYGFQLLQC